jgi:hypothetical protein
MSGDVGLDAAGHQIEYHEAVLGVGDERSHVAVELQAVQIAVVFQFAGNLAIRFYFEKPARRDTASLVLQSLSDKDHWPDQFPHEHRLAQGGICTHLCSVPQLVSGNLSDQSVEQSLTRGKGY